LELEDRRQPVLLNRLALAGVELEMHGNGNNAGNGDCTMTLAGGEYKRLLIQFLAFHLTLPDKMFFGQLYLQHHGLSRT